MMKRYFGQAVAALALLLGGTQASNAATCVNSSLADLVGTSCEFGGLTFSNWQFDTSDDIIQVTFSSGSNVTDNWVNVSFQFTDADVPVGDSDDVLIQYMVSGRQLNGIDNQLIGTSGYVYLTEEACLDSACAQRVAELATYTQVAGTFLGFNPTQQLSAIDYFDPAANSLWIFKDLRIGNTRADPDLSGGLSEMVNSHHFVPEPGTLALFALGLLGFGATRRRLS